MCQMLGINGGKTDKTAAHKTFACGKGRQPMYTRVKRMGQVVRNAKRKLEEEERAGVGRGRF